MQEPPAQEQPKPLRPQDALPAKGGLEHYKPALAEQRLPPRLDVALDLARLKLP